MKVKRIIANVVTSEGAEAKRFYRDVLGLEEVMNSGWIRVYGSTEQVTGQISVAADGGSGAPTPELSIEVDNLAAALASMRGAGFEPIYGPTDEPWGVRRFFVRDPFGTIVNIMARSG